MKSLELMREYRLMSGCPKCRNGCPGDSSLNENGMSLNADGFSIKRICKKCRHEWDEWTHDAPRTYIKERMKKSDLPIPFLGRLFG